MNTDLKLYNERESFIAGLDDPAIIQQPENWDILCNIDTGTIQFSSFSPIKKESHDYQSICALDSEFFAKVLFTYTIITIIIIIIINIIIIMMIILLILEIY